MRWLALFGSTFSIHFGQTCPLVAPGLPQKTQSVVGFDMSKSLDDTKRLTGALVRMKPKQHEDMKLRKSKGAARKRNPKKKA
jgi:hypothetical protein